MGVYSHTKSQKAIPCCNYFLDVHNGDMNNLYNRTLHKQAIERRKLIRGLADTGLKQHEFAERHGFPEALVSLWVRNLRKPGRQNSWRLWEVTKASECPISPDAWDAPRRKSFRNQ